jgi:hypothetical protein
MENETYVHVLVMPGLVPGIHVLPRKRWHVDGRDKPGHDDVEKSGRMIR